jgi:spermidine synthase
LPPAACSTSWPQGAIASYVLGDSVLQFSTIIGAYLFAMGVGLLAVALLRAATARALSAHRAAGGAGRWRPAGVAVLANATCRGRSVCCCTHWCCVVGMLVGLEIPLVMRILKRNVALKDLVSQVLTFDYLGALAVSRGVSAAAGAATWGWCARACCLA